MTNSVEVKKLSFNYGKVEILKNLDLDIQDGEFMVLLGPSGCGKTTLLNCIAGLLDIDEGQIWIENDRDCFRSNLLCSRRQTPLEMIICP